MFETRDLPFHELPEGEGPPILLTAKHGDWTRLGFGQGRLVRFSEDPGGAFAFGLLQSVVLIWVYLPPDEPGRAYCYHAPLGPLTPQIHRAALAALECAEHAHAFLHVVIASGREITPEEEAAVLRFGVRADRVYTYSNALLSQFGVSHAGCVGEAG
ncbi:MAG: hypothetical protein P8170_19360 [Gemmatimonadota bacterium]|jgi:hypothetical protein